MSKPIFFEFPPTRSNRVKWALEELGVDYDSRIVDFMTGQQQSIAHKQVHPLGHVPALRTAQFEMHESVAILLQLLDDYPEKGLAPPIGSPLRATYYQWCVFASAELDHCLHDVMKHTMHNAERGRVPEIAKRGKIRVNERCEILSAALNDRDFLLGDQFSGADIAIGYDINWVDYVRMLDGHPRLAEYYERLKRRPAFHKVFLVTR